MIPPSFMTSNALFISSFVFMGFKIVSVAKITIITGINPKFNSKLDRFYRLYEYFCMTFVPINFTNV